MNTLRSQMTCPRCGVDAQVEIECHFGVDNLIEYNLGDEVQWVKGKTVQNGGRPTHGNHVAEGYVECEHCKKDFFISIEIQSDRILSVKVSGTLKWTPFFGPRG